MTFSIVARDRESGELGIAVQSRFLAVGAVVPWAKAGVGAIATQSLANTSYGPRGLELLASGLSAVETVRRLTSEDEARVSRQVGIIGRNGEPATYTGDECFPWAGGHVGEHYTCQGNILVSEETVLSMARAFEQATGHLCDRQVRHSREGRQQEGIVVGSNQRHCSWCVQVEATLDSTTASSTCASMTIRILLTS
jgi:uncharacterized Ntn-hydrolase superfamily protein